MLERRGLRERAFGTQEADLEGLLLREARRHDFAEEPQDLLGAQRTLVPVACHAQHLRLAFGPVEVDGMPVRVLRDSDLARQARAIVEQAVDLRVHRVDLPPQG
jgi:hypothetical protein